MSFIVECMTPRSSGTAYELVATPDVAGPEACVTGEAVDDNGSCCSGCCNWAIPIVGEPMCGEC